jgi:speckle-type POZ protein
LDSSASARARAPLPPPPFFRAPAPRPHRHLTLPPHPPSTHAGEHEHTIVGYSLVKGIGDGEPIASERFSVGGHEWVLLFYPDGKRSSSEAAAGGAGGGAAPGAAARAAGLVPPAPGGGGPGAPRALPAPPAPPPGAPAGAAAQAQQQQLALVPHAGAQHAHAPAPAHLAHHHGGAAAPLVPPPPPGNDYCALFVALIGEGEAPQGVVSTSEGRVVRAFHRFTLVDQSGRGGDVAKGRRRDQGAVKISCARQDPNARNCHGYRKFVKKALLEDPGRGLLVNDTLVIRYQVELVVSTGGALSRHAPGARALPSVAVPPPSLGGELAALLESGAGADVAFEVDGEAMPAHKIVLAARSEVFRALLSGPMREGRGDAPVRVEDVRAPVFRALLHFAYRDELPEGMRGAGLEVAMAQHLLAAADRFQLGRLRAICERRLCETVEAESVATTLALAEQNNARELKRVCLDFVSRHLQAVMATEGYAYMTATCPQLQSELLAVLAAAPADARRHSARAGGAAPAPGAGGAGGGGAGGAGGRAPDESSTDGQLRRVRQRRE